VTGITQTECGAEEHERVGWPPRHPGPAAYYSKTSVCTLKQAQTDIACHRAVYHHNSLTRNNDKDDYLSEDIRSVKAT
jgi:hypothetical protein